MSGKFQNFGFKKIAHRRLLQKHFLNILSVLWSKKIFFFDQNYFIPFGLPFANFLDFLVSNKNFFFSKVAYNDEKVIFRELARKKKILKKIFVMQRENKNEIGRKNKFRPKLLKNNFSVILKNFWEKKYYFSVVPLCIFQS